jgi:hypothetical protein
MSDDNSLRPAGTLAFEDIVRFQYFHINRRLWPLTLMVLLGALFAVLGIAAVSLTGDIERIKNPGLLYAILLCWALLFLGSPVLAARKQYRKQQYLREEMQYDFTNDGVGLQGPSFSTKIAWPLVQSVYETKTGFLIYQSPQSAWILPKRFFPTGDTAVWKKFVREHLTSPNLLRGSKWLASWF